MAAKTVELVHLSELFGKLRRRYTVPQFPTGAMIHFAKREAYKATCAQIGITQYRIMRHIIKYNMLVYFVGYDDDIGALHDRSQLPDVFFPQHGAGGVMR